MTLKITKIVIAPVKYKSSLETPKAFPNKKSFKSKCTPSCRLIREIHITPIENIAVKTIPMAASFLIGTLRCNQVISTAVTIPAKTAPAKNPKTL